jgi:hypothetical protein
VSDQTDGFLALLTGGPTVYEAKVPTQADGSLPVRPYVVVYAPSGHQMVYNLTGQSQALDDEWQTTVVGDEADSVRVIQAWVKSRLLDAVPTVTGRICYPIRHSYGNPARRDDDVHPSVVYATDGWRCASVPSS